MDKQQEQIERDFGFDHPSFDDPGGRIEAVPDSVLEQLVEDDLRKHGGKREGAGRPSTGRKRLSAFVTDAEREAIYRAVPRLRETKD